MFRALFFVAWIGSSLACIGDLAEVQSEPLCTDVPVLWTADEWAAIKDVGGAALLLRWESDARCRVYQVRAAAFRLATDEESDFTLLKALAAQLTLQAAHLRDHLEGLLDHNWQNPNPSCTPDPKRPTRPERRDTTAYATLCVEGSDLSWSLFDILTSMEQHSGFSADSDDIGMLRRHSEHVLNCAQTSGPIDWDSNGNPEQVCGDDLADYGLRGEGPGDFISALLAQAQNHVQP